MKKCLRKMLASLLIVVMMFPANVFAQETRIDQSTNTNVDKIISYANQLRNSSNSNSSTSGFVWDTEKKSYSWSYYNGLMMDAYMSLGGDTNFNFVDTFYNANINSDGSIVNLSQGKVSSGALDSCEPLRATFDLLSSSSRSSKYKSAIQKWYLYLENQITYSNCGGNYAHKQDNTTTVTSSWAEYPVALDGLYMAQPFLMETANAIDKGILTIKDKNNRTVSSSTIYNAVYNRFAWIYDNLYNSSTGLYDHGYNPSTRRTNGVSWSRSIGWYVMALVDVIEMMPEGSMKNNLISELPRIFDGLLRYQDASGLWYNVTAYNSSLWGNNQNILETSGTSMFAYAMVKATQNGYVTDSKYYDAALKAFNGVVNTKLKGSQGNYSVVDTYRSSGASTNPSYYCNNTYTTNEAKGIGSLIMLAALLKNNSTVSDTSGVGAEIPMQTVTTVTYERATTIDTNSEYLMANGSNGNVKILGHTGYNVYNSDATVTNNKLESSFSHANGDDSYYLWKFSQANTSTNQTSSPVISNATPLGSNENTSYIQNWDRNQIGAWGGGITVVNKGGYFTMKQWDNYIDAGSTQNATSAKNIYLFKKVVTTTQVPAVHEHDYVVISETAGNCTTKGTKTTRCSICQEEMTEETTLGDHSPEFKREFTGDCSNKGYKVYACKVCGNETSEPTTYGQHNYEFTNETNGNCSVKGHKEFTCSICGDTKQEETSYGDHSPVFNREVAGDCSNKGYKVYVCEICGNETNEPTTYGDHNFTFTREVVGNCSAKGYNLYTCSICHTTKKEETTFGSHNYEFSNEIAGDCVTKGHKEFTCIYCNDKKQEETSLGSHSYELINEVAGDCSTKGHNEFTCSICGDSKQEETAFGSHNYEFVSETEGTCSVKGVKTYKCSICKETKTENTTFGDHSPVYDHEVAGNCSNKGYKVYVCEICGNETNEPTTFGDHDYQFTKDVPGTCVTMGHKVYTCTICNDKKQVETTLGSHNYEFSNEVAGDCVTKGHKVFTCTYCNDTKQEETTLGSHSYELTDEVAGDCSTKGHKEFTCSICGDSKQEETTFGSHNYEFVNETEGTCIEKGVKTYKCSICKETKTEATTYGSHSPIYDHEVAGDCSNKGYKVYVCELCGNETTEATTYGSHNYQYTKDVAGTCVTKGHKLYTCSICKATKQEETTLGTHNYELVAEQPAVNGNNGYKRYTCTYCNDTYQEDIEPEYEIVEQTETTVVYELATSITPGQKYIIASGNNGNVTIIGNNNGSAFKATANVSNGRIDMSNKNINQFMWTFNSATSGKIYNNGLYVKTSSASQFNTTGEQMAITNRGGGAYQIKKTTSTGSTFYLNPNNLTSKTSSAVTVYLFKEVTKTVTTRYEVHYEYVDTQVTAYERATTIDTNSEYLMASGSNGNVKILGHSGYNVYNSDATVSGNELTSAFSHANGNDANYLWKFSQSNTSANQTSTPVISNATSLGSNEPTSYIQNWDRNQIGAWGGGITVVNKGGYFTMKQWDNYIDAGSTQNSTSAKNIYLFKKTTKTVKTEQRVLVKL